MNTKGMKFLAVLAVLAMAFAVFAVVSDSESSDAASSVTEEQFFNPDDENPATEVKTGSTITVKLLDDLDLEGPITLPSEYCEGTKYVIDLNGKNIYAYDEAAFDVKSGTTVTFTGSGEIEGDVLVAGAVTIDKSVEIDDIYVSDTATEVIIKGTADDVEITGGESTEVTIDTTAKVYGIETSGATVTVKGESWYGIYATSGTVYVKNGATVGEVTADGTATVKLQGGNFTDGIYKDSSDASIKVTGGTYSDYSVLRYTDSGSTGASVVAGGLTINGSEAVTVDDTFVVNGTLTIPGTSKATVFIVPEGLTFTDLAVSAGDKKIVVIFDGDYTIADAALKYNNGAIALYDYTSITAGSITLGTATTASAKLSNLTGTFTFYQGSIAVDVDSASGTIELADGQELKLSGNVGNLEIKLIEGAKSAKVTVEADAEVRIGGGRLTIADKIAVNVYGKVIGNGRFYAESIEAFDGAVIKNVYVYAAGTAWSGSDINFAYFNDFSSWTGKDANGGTWSVNDRDQLTLNNYKGTYNFNGYFSNGGDDTAISGDVVVSYAPVMEEDGPPNFIMTYFSGKIATVQDSGSLTLNIDISGLKYPMPVNGIMATKIDTVGINVDISGTPVFEEEIPMFIMATGLMVIEGDIFNAPINVDVLSDEGIGMGIGAVIMGDITSAGTINAKGSMVGAVIMGEVKETSIATEGKLIDSMFYGVLASNSSLTGKTAFVIGANIAQGSSLIVENLVLGMPMEMPMETADIEEVVPNTIINDGTIKTTGKSIIWSGAIIQNAAVFENSGDMGVFGTIENRKGAIDGTAGVFTNTGNIYFHSFITQVAPSSVDDTFETYQIAVDDTAPMTTSGEIDKSKARVAELDVQISTIIELITGMDRDTEIDFENFDINNFEFDMDGIQALIDGVIPVKATISSFYLHDDYADYKCKTVFEGTITINSEGYVLSVSNGSTAITVTSSSFDADGPSAYETFEYTIVASGSVTLTGVDGTGKTVTKTLALVNNSEDAEINGSMIYSGFDPTDDYFYAEAGTVNNNGAFIVDSVNGYYGSEQGMYATTIDKDATFNGDIIVKGSVLEIFGTFNGNITAPRVYVDGNEDAQATVTGGITADYVEINPYGTLDGSITAGAQGVYLAGTVTGTVTMTKADSEFFACGNVNVSVSYIGEYKATYGESVEPSAFEVAFDVLTELESGDVTLLMMPAVDATETEAGMPGYIAYYDVPEAIDGKVTVTLNAGALKADGEKFPIGYVLVVEKGATLEVAKNSYLDVKTAALKVSLDAVRNYGNVDFGEIRYIMSFDITGYTIYSNIAYALENCEPNTTITLGDDGVIDADVDVKTGVNFVIGDGLELTINDVNVTMQDGAKFTIEGTGVITFVAHNLADGKDKSISGIFEYDGNAIKMDGVHFYEAATIEGRPATDDAPSMLDIDVRYYGTISATAGNVTGDIAVIPYLDQQKNEVSDAAFIIDAGAAAVTPRLVTQSNHVAGFDEDDTLVASIVAVNGTLYAERLNIDGVFLGGGQVVILEDGEVTVATSAILDIVIADENGNGYGFDGVEFSALTLSSENVAGDYIVMLDGSLSAGDVNALKEAYVDDLNIGKDAAIIADAFHISGDIKALGKIKTKTALSAAELASVDYDATYAEGDYTVYTWFMYIDQTEVTDITVDGGAFTGHMSGAGLQFFTIAGINLTIMDRTAIALDVPIIIGTPRTSIGAGTVVTGTIVITSGNHVIVYDGAEVSADSIKASNGTTAAVSSNFDIEGTQYAVVYANESTPLAGIADTMKPAIAGYTFTMWVAYNTMAPIGSQSVGDTDVTATLIPGKVTVNAVAYEGVAYYCNGVEFMSVGMDVQVDVGSIFTAKIVDKDKLEGTPLVNGETSFKVTQEFNVLEISGVTEKKAPSNDDDDGIGLTEILLIVLVVLIAVMCVILILRLNRS